MSLPSSIDDREYQKFEEVDGEVAVRMATGGMIDFKYDYVVETEPNTTTELYTFKTGGASGTDVATITVVYADSTKARLVSATKVLL